MQFVIMLGVLRVASDLFNGFSRDEDVYLIRYKPGKLRDGIVSAPRAFKRRLKDGYSIQPLTESDVTMMPDGLTRTTSALKIFTIEPIYAAKAEQNIKADEIEIAGTVYQVDTVNNFSFGSLPHFEGIVMKVAT